MNFHSKLQKSLLLNHFNKRPEEEENKNNIKTLMLKRRTKIKSMASGQLVYVHICLFHREARERANGNIIFRWCEIEKYKRAISSPGHL